MAKTQQYLNDQHQYTMWLDSKTMQHMIERMSRLLMAHQHN